MPPMFLLVVGRADDAVKITFTKSEFKREFDIVWSFYRADTGYIPMAGVVGVLDAFLL